VTSSYPDRQVLARHGSAVSPSWSMAASVAGAVSDPSEER
nr:hypothetical protein [Tanacetum cinerariifolium]